MTSGLLAIICGSSILPLVVYWGASANVEKDATFYALIISSTCRGKKMVTFVPMPILLEIET